MSVVKKAKMRRTIRYIFICLALVLIAFSFGKLFLMFSGSRGNTKVNEMKYTNGFNYDYTVNLIDNKFITKKSLDKSYLAYVTELIDNINLRLDYKYSSSEVLPLNYKYKVLGRFNAVYPDDGEKPKIWDKEYLLKAEEIGSTNNAQFEVKEDLQLDLKSLNELINEFEIKMAMTLESTYTVIFQIETEFQVNGRSIVNVYSPSVVIGLGEKTTKISGENEGEITKYVTKDIVHHTSEVSILTVVLYGVLLIFSVMMLRYLCFSTQNANSVRNEYKKELNRILKLCQDKIVQITTKPDVNEGSLVEVKDFGEILKLSEELFKPILCWSVKGKDEAWFMIISNNVTYRCVLKR